MKYPMSDVSNTLNCKTKSHKTSRSKSPKKQSTRSTKATPNRSDVEDTRILPPPTLARNRAKFSSDDPSSTRNPSTNNDVTSEMSQRFSSMAVSSTTTRSNHDDSLPAPQPTALQISKKFKKQSRTTKSTTYAKKVNDIDDHLKDPVSPPSKQEEGQQQQYPSTESRAIDPRSAPKSSSTSSIEISNFRSSNPPSAELNVDIATEKSQVTDKMERSKSEAKGYRKKNHHNNHAWNKKKGQQVQALSVEGKRIDVAIMNNRDDDANSATHENSIPRNSVIHLQYSSAKEENVKPDAASDITSVGTNETTLDGNRDKFRIKGRNKIHGRKRYHGGKKRPSKRLPMKKIVTRPIDNVNQVLTSNNVQLLKDDSYEENQDSESAVDIIKNTGISDSSRPSHVVTNAAGQALLNRLNMSCSTSNHVDEVDDTNDIDVPGRTSIPSKIDLEDASGVNSSMMGGEEGSEDQCEHHQHPITELNYYPPELYDQQYESERPQTEQQQTRAHIDMTYNPSMMYQGNLPLPHFMNMPNGLPFSIGQQYAVAQPFLLPYQEFYPSNGNAMTYVNSIQHPLAPKPIRYEQVTINGTVFFNAVYSESDTNNAAYSDGLATIQKSDNNNKKEKQKKKRKNKKYKKKHFQKQNCQRQNEDQKADEPKED